MKRIKEIEHSNIIKAIQDVINYIEHDAEIAIPINEFFNIDGTHITKKKYGHILLKYLVLELKEKYINNINNNNNNTKTIRVSDDDTAKTCIDKMADILNALNVPYTLGDNNDNDNDNDNDIDKGLLSISFEYKSNSTTSKLISD